MAAKIVHGIQYVHKTTRAGVVCMFFSLDVIRRSLLHG